MKSRHLAEIIYIVSLYIAWLFYWSNSDYFCIQWQKSRFSSSSSSSFVLHQMWIQRGSVIAMTIISAPQLWCVTLRSLSCVLTQSRLPGLQPAVLQRQCIIESRVKIASGKLFSVAILYQGEVGRTDESRAPDLTISRSETSSPEAKSFVCVGEYQHEQGTPAGDFTTGTCLGNCWMRRGNKLQEVPNSQTVMS